jgi:DNA-directed RNA polymerase specialized sigma24 family protein
MEDTAGFDDFLASLAPDKEQAAERYEKNRRALIKYFTRRQATDPEECAARVLNVVRKKIANGIVIQNLGEYCFAVARNFQMKDRAESRKRAELPDEMEDKARSPLEIIIKEAEKRCMIGCLRKLSADNWSLITQYYGSEYDSGKKHNRESREELARRQGITMQSLRTRVNRIKVDLKECLDDCLGKRSHKV